MKQGVVRTAEGNQGNAPQSGQPLPCGITALLLPELLIFLENLDSLNLYEIS